MPDHMLYAQQRLGRAADVTIVCHERGHYLISIAARRPSDSTLKAIEVAKINTPGSAASQGCTWIAVRKVLSIKPHSGFGGVTPRPRNERPEARIIETEMRLVENTKIGPITLPSTCTRTIVKALAPDARAASTKSLRRTCVVTLSAIRAICGMNTTVSDTSALPMPVPSAPDNAMASSTDGKA